MSLVLIVTCHMLQYLDIELSRWANVGVQIYLCLSGYLYGRRDLSDPIPFYHRRLKKLLPGFYLVYVPAAAAELLFVPGTIGLATALKGLVLRETIPGGGPLWFLTLILMCYLLTPLLYAYRARYVTDARSLWRYAFLVAFTVSLYFGLFARQHVLYHPAWICCYAAGYVLGIDAEGGWIREGRIFLLAAVLAVLMNGVQIWHSYIVETVFTGIAAKLWPHFCNYAHAALGVALFLAMKRAVAGVDLWRIPVLSRLLALSDAYNYEAYLVHGFLILGPFSLMELTPWLPADIAVILLGIVVLAWLLARAERKVRELLRWTI